MVQISEAYVGLYWGDEGKGKLVSLAARRARALNGGKRTVVVRYNGGPNAGHTDFVEMGEKGLVRFITHAAPSGLTSGSDIAIGPQVAFAPEQFMKELNDARDLFEYDARIMISERAGVLFDYHLKLDGWQEEQARESGSDIGTTKRGIGPFYQDNARRATRITFADYVSDKFPDVLRRVLELKRFELEAAGIWRADYFDELVSVHDPIRRELRPCAERLEYRLIEMMENGDNIIIEGANGSGLDVDMGTIPDQSSSHILAPHAFPSLGLPRARFKIYGVEKAYPTRVGAGPMPTLDTGDFGKEVADNAGEEGATTRRKRRVGYPDLVWIRRSVMLNDCDGIIITRIDNVQDRDIKVCTRYRTDEGIIDEVPLKLEGVVPIYRDETYRWHLWDGPKDLSDARAVHNALRSNRMKYVEGGFDSLPEGLKKYIAEHDAFVGVPTVGLSIGPTSDETVLKEVAPVPMTA